MGMHTVVYGYRPPDEKWKKMKAVWDACGEAGCDRPIDVIDFFQGEPPKADGVRVEKLPGGCVELVEKGHPECGYKIAVDKIPHDLTYIVVENLW